MPTFKHILIYVIFVDQVTKIEDIWKFIKEFIGINTILAIIIKLCFWYKKINPALFIFLFLVFLEHDQLDSYINEMVIQNEDVLGKRPTFYCGICQHQGNTKQDVERHVESFHIQTQPFYCPTCGASYKTRRTLKIHQRSHKNLQLWYFCPIFIAFDVRK